MSDDRIDLTYTYLGDLREEVLTHYPECRERSLALTKLDEFEMWLEKARW